ncbi:hypothetical protein AJ87_02900 [Rhizobium yanglingense]|nr:hypothetical protein AJ87_02900 [Rhizobium yanglingense]
MREGVEQLGIFGRKSFLCHGLLEFAGHPLRLRAHINEALNLFQSRVVYRLLARVLVGPLDRQRTRWLRWKLLDQEFCDGVRRAGDTRCHSLKRAALVGDLLSFVAVITFPQIPKLQFLKWNLFATFQGNNDIVLGFVGRVFLFGIR